MQYSMSAALKERVMTVINLMQELDGLKGGIYHYDSNECSCCYGLKGYDFEINDNIPENWGVYDSKDERDAYHKVTYDLDLAQATRLVKTFRNVLRGSGWKVNWRGDVGSAILLEQQKAI